jgi:hypothetical protein
MALLTDLIIFYNKQGYHAWKDTDSGGYSDTKIKMKNY